MAVGTWRAKVAAAFALCQHRKTSFTSDDVRSYDLIALGFVSSIDLGTMNITSLYSALKILLL
jgi:hypothetical protein